MFDLLASLPDAEPNTYGEPLSVTENQDGTYVKGLASHLAQNEEEALNLLFEVIFLSAKHYYAITTMTRILVIQTLFQFIFIPAQVQYYL